ncbi:hypothetical protein [Bosea sp. (in: a-proteobacteria)]|jgi:hypothetical protein|uniref:hypothetical protein n=1 Tax=Bosea sp. (in: a-proteobacteria) TaxID=1871050 RepID=UPI0035696567
MPRKVSFQGNTLVLNDEVPAGLKVGDRARYTIHDWHEGEHTLSGEIVGLKPGEIARVKIGSGIAGDIVHDVPLQALSLVNIVSMKGDR